MKAAIFDIDSTIISTSSQRQFIYHLIDKKQLSVFYIAFTYILFFFKNIWTLDWYMFKHYFLYLRGHNAKLYKRLAKEAFDKRTKSFLYPKALKLIKSLKRKKYKILVLTGSLNFVTVHIKNYLKADYFIATDFVIKNGKFTGEIKGTHPFSRNKAIVLHKFAKKHNIDLKQSYAYADHYTDRYFLGMVGKPVVANPKPRLRKYAEKKGWNIVYF